VCGRCNSSSGRPGRNVQTIRGPVLPLQTADLLPSPDADAAAAAAAGAAAAADTAVARLAGRLVLLPRRSRLLGRLALRPSWPAAGRNLRVRRSRQSLSRPYRPIVDNPYQPGGPWDSQRTYVPRSIDPGLEQAGQACPMCCLPFVGPGRTGTVLLRFRYTGRIDHRMALLVPARRFPGPATDRDRAQLQVVLQVQVVRQGVRQVRRCRLRCPRRTRSGSGEASARDQRARSCSGLQSGNPRAR